MGDSPNVRAAADTSTSGTACAAALARLDAASVADQRKLQLTALNATPAHTSKDATGNIQREDALKTVASEGR
jgi:hypothetical protein